MVSTSDVPFFRLIQKTLLANKIEFYSFNLSTERTIKIVVKEILLNISNNEFKNELKNLNFKTHIVKRFGFSNKPLPIFLVILYQTTSAKDILAFNSLFF